MILDSDLGRQYQMQERRMKIIQPLTEQLNPKAYMGFYQELLNELIEIMSDMYDNRYLYFYVNKVKPINK